MPTQEEIVGLEAILKPVENRTLLMQSLAQAMHDYIDEAPRESDDFLEGLDCTGDQAKAVFDDLLLFIIGCDDLYMNSGEHKADGDHGTDCLTARIAQDISKELGGEG